ncbi:MAG: sulfurtransferase [Propionibacteriaceae bacterium]
MTIVIDASQLVAMLGAELAPVIIDTRWVLSAKPVSGGQRSEYEKAHIPGAHFVDLDTELSAAPHSDQGFGGRHPLPDPGVFQAAMRRCGVTKNRAVVIYDQNNSMAAARLWWLLTDAGQQQVYVLDGGWDAWLRSGGAIESGPDRSEVSSWTASFGHRDRVDACGVQKALDSRRRVIDVRAAERYRGEVEPLDPKAGHIPGAESVPAADLQNPDGTFLAASQIAKRIGEISVGDVISCGSGVTAANALLALENAGIVGAVIYPGSWSDWCARDLPCATGDN